MVCSQCGSDAHGRFCPSCGAPTRSLKCRGCSRKVEPGTRFCTHCGTPAAGQAEGGRTVGSTAAASAPGVAAGRAGGWWVSAGLLGALAVVVAFSEISSRGEEEAALPTQPPPTGAAAVDLSAMSPRQAADQLFDRVMRAFSATDTVQARTFLPMAIEAHRLAEPLDPDGLFHLSLLQQAAGDTRGALESATAGLRDNPRHLLNLSAAADAARELGDVEGARERYRALLEAWDQEMAAGRPEYQHHSELLPLLRGEAERFLGGTP